MFCLLTACGFHLRGLQDVSTDKQQIFLIPNTADTQLIKAIRQQLKANKISESPDALWQLEIVTFNYERQIISLNEQASVDEFQLNLKTVVRIMNAKGEAVGKDTSLLRQRTYTINRDTAAANSEQEKQIRQNLYDSMAQAIIRKWLLTK